MIICKYEKNTLDRYLGKIIIKTYKKKNPKKQSIWSSDTSRLTYVVRELFANKKIDWTIDKKGVKAKNYIINPLLKHIKQLLQEYIKIYSITERDEIDMRDYAPKLHKMNKMTQIMQSIDNGKLAENVLNHIAPEFYLNKDNGVKAIEE